MKLCLFLLSLCLITFTVSEDPCSNHGEAEDCNSDTTNSCQWTQTETGETGSCKIKENLVVRVKKAIVMILVRWKVLDVS